MITVTIGNNLNRKDHILESSTTLRDAFDKAGVNYSIGVSSLDGASLLPGDIGKTFDDFGVKDRCFLLNVVKADNAA